MAQPDIFGFVFAPVQYVATALHDLNGEVTAMHDGDEGPVKCLAFADLERATGWAEYMIGETSEEAGVGSQYGDFVYENVIPESPTQLHLKISSPRSHTVVWIVQVA